MEVAYLISGWAVEKSGMGGTAAETLSSKDANLVSTRKARAVAELKLEEKASWRGQRDFVHDP
jgi:hypothetical protein